MTGFQHSKASRPLPRLAAWQHMFREGAWDRGAVWGWESSMRCFQSEGFLQEVRWEALAGYQDEYFSLSWMNLVSLVLKFSLLWDQSRLYALKYCKFMYFSVSISCIHFMFPVTFHHLTACYWLNSFPREVVKSVFHAFIFLGKKTYLYV